MTFFESLLMLMLTAILLLQLARHLSLPYPVMLAGAGVIVALIPGTPSLSIEPATYLALFMAPALVDAAYDFPPEATRRFVAPLIAYAVVAVLLTAGVVAWIGSVCLGLPLAAGIALGAIVAPPDAAAATAILRKFRLPRQTDAILKGESLFNDATALLLFNGALIVLERGGLTLPVATRLALAPPGGLLLGIGFSYLARPISLRMRNTLGGNLFQFVSAYLLWIAAEHLHLSAVLTVIGFAMAYVRNMRPGDFDARMRVQSFAVWSSVVFTLNVFAFLLMGMQARSIVMGMQGSYLREASRFAVLVVLAVITVRLMVVLGFSRWQAARDSPVGGSPPVTFRQALFVGWCGMRGFVTMAAAFGLPPSFPHRDIVVLTAFAVVLATLVIQGLTLAPLVQILNLDRTKRTIRELSLARVVLARRALASVEDQAGPEAENLKYRLVLRLSRCMDGAEVASGERLRQLSLTAIEAERAALEGLRAADKIGSEEYLDLQEQLDWQELTFLDESNRRIEEI